MCSSNFSERICFLETAAFFGSKGKLETSKAEKTENIYVNTYCILLVFFDCACVQFYHLISGSRYLMFQRHELVQRG